MKTLILILAFSLATASEREFLDHIFTNIGDRWVIGYIAGEDTYFIRTKVKYNVALTGGSNLFGKQNIHVYGSFKIYTYKSDDELLRDRQSKKDKLTDLLETAKGIKQENQKGWIQFEPNSSEQMMLVKEIEPLQAFANAYPEYHYKGDIFVAHVNWPELYPTDEAANIIYADISRINKLLRKVLKP